MISGARPTLVKRPPCSCDRAPRAVAIDAARTRPDKRGMDPRPAVNLHRLRRPLAAGLGVLYLALAILAHFAHEAPARAAEIDPLGLGAPICWGADAPETPTSERTAAVCEACLLAKSLTAPPPSEAGAFAAPALVRSLGEVRPDVRAPTTRRLPAPPARGPPRGLS